MWNLSYLQLVLEESGIDVINLGPCVPVATTLQTLAASQADALVISSVNGHGFWQGLALREAALRSSDILPPFLIGGKLATSDLDNGFIAQELRAAGFAEVFVGSEAIPELQNWLTNFKECFAARLQTMPEGVSANEPTLQPIGRCHHTDPGHEYRCAC
jgi:methylmalonyl-CoA mutase cobalamin-binding subunit